MKNKKFIKLTLCFFVFNAVYMPYNRPIGAVLATPTTIAATALAGAALAHICYQALYGHNNSLALERLKQELYTCYITPDAFSEKGNCPLLSNDAKQRFNDTYCIFPQSIQHMVVQQAEVAVCNLREQTVATLVSCIHDSVYRQKFIDHLNTIIFTLWKINSDDFIERILARLDLLHLQSIGFYEIQLGVIQSKLIRLLFSKDGYLSLTIPIKEARKALKQFIGVLSSNPDAFVERFHDNDYQKLSWNIRFKAWGRSFFNIQNRGLHNKENEILRAYIKHYQNLNFKKARSIACQAPHYQALLKDIDNYFKHFYRTTSLQKIFETQDPLVNRIDFEQQDEITKDLVTLEQFAQTLTSRKKIVHSIIDEWTLQPNPVLEQVIYQLLDQHAFENPLKLIRKLFACINQQSDDARQYLISAFFLPNGVLKDFANYDTIAADQYLFLQTPPSTDLEQLYVLNLFLIMGNCVDPDIICEAYSMINHWSYLDAPLNGCCIQNPSEIVPWSCFPDAIATQSVVQRPCIIVPEQTLTGCGTGKQKIDIQQSLCCSQSSQKRDLADQFGCGYGKIFQKQGKNSSHSHPMNKNRLTFRPEDFENFEVDFPIKEVW